MIDNRENNHWTVYIHIVPKELSGYEWDKYYVGVTGTSVQERWHNGLGYKRNNRPGCYFYKAINKYGWENIKHEIIAEHLTLDECKRMEIVLIEKLNSFNPKYGYNRTKGGDGLVGHKHSDATRLKLSNSLRGKNVGKNHPNSIPVVQFSLNGNFLNIYESVTQATKNKKYPEIKDSSLICRALKNQTYIAYNYIWIKPENTIKENNIYKLTTDDYKKYTKKDNFIYKFDLAGKYIEKYKNAIDAAKSENIQYTCIIYEAYRRKRASHGFIWLEEQDVSFKNNSISIPNFDINNFMNVSKEIYVFDKMGNFINKYKSITEASEKTGIERHSIRNVLSGKTIPRKFIFKYEEDIEESKNNPGSFLIKSFSVNMAKKQ